MISPPSSSTASPGWNTPISINRSYSARVHWRVRIGYSMLGAYGSRTRASTGRIDDSNPSLVADSDRAPGSGRGAVESADLAERGAQRYRATERIGDLGVDQRVVVRRAR